MSDLIHWYAPWSGRLLVGSIVLLALVGCVWAFLRRQKLHEPHCPFCGYSMTRAASPRCPECGRDSNQCQQHRGGRHWKIALVCLLIAVTVPTLVAIRRMRQYGWDYYLTFGPGHYFFGRYTVDRVRVGDQSMRIVGDRSNLVVDESLEVHSNHGTTRLKAVSWFLGDTLSGGGMVGRGEDITGDGRPNIVVREYSGGAHCCTTYHIYEVSSTGTLTEIASIDAQNGGGFEDRDGDGFPEFILPDWTWAYELTCFACLRYPHVILKFDGRRYAPSVELMREAQPEVMDVAAWLGQAAADQARSAASPDSTMLRDQMWGEMLHLIYTGYATTAWALYDAGWYEQWGDKTENLNKFRAILKRSPYWSELNELNGGALE